MVVAVDVRTAAVAVDVESACPETVAQGVVGRSAEGLVCTEMVFQEADHTEADHWLRKAARAEDVVVVLEALRLATEQVMDELSSDVDCVVAVCCEVCEAAVLKDMVSSDTVGHYRAGLEAAGISGAVVPEAEHGVDVEMPMREVGVSWSVADLEQPAALVK